MVGSCAAFGLTNSNMIDSISYAWGSRSLRVRWTILPKLHLFLGAMPQPREDISNPKGNISPANFRNDTETISFLEGQIFSKKVNANPETRR